MLKVGEQAPLFEAVSQNNEPVRLADYIGRKVILYFYPKDNTSGCTLEAKSLRDGKKALAEMGFEIVGVSPDSVKSHQNFCAKHELNFTLVADTDKSVATAYDVWKEKSMYGRKYMGIVRTTFIIDEQGKIIHIFDKVKTADHWQQIAQWWGEYNK
ncbi:MAG: thioredoxin-dependent thiol peroxidase [Rikenellaceae bacterium]|nr:thioredoxin-dependent thiol peroxidase [Rikenellaceae bacterium]